MIPRLRPALGWRELAAALRPPQADDVARFEAAFARKMGARHALAFPYGRTGLYLLPVPVCFAEHIPLPVPVPFVYLDHERVAAG